METFYKLIKKIASSPLQYAAYLHSRLLSVGLSIFYWVFNMVRIELLPV